MPFSQILTSIKHNKYIYSLTILVIFFLISQLIVLISKKILLQLTKRTKTKIDDVIVIKTHRVISIMLLLLGIRLALSPLGIKEGALKIIWHLTSSLIVVLLTYIVIVVMDVIIDNWARRVAEKTNSSLDDELFVIFKKFLRIFISFIGVMFILPIWGLQIGPLLASLGIVGIAVAFALQSTLGNIFGGASLLLDKSIKVGDEIAVDKETFGTVVDVGLRSTKIRTPENEIVTIPNGKLAESKILNFGQPNPTVQVHVDFGVAYGSDVQKVKKIVNDAVLRTPNVLKKPEPEIWMTEMGDSAIKFKAEFWTDKYNVKQREDTKFFATEEIYKALAKAGIDIPFPTRTVHLKEKK